MFGITEEQKKRLEDRYLGKKIRIVNMNGETHYAGATGIVELVDDIGQLHGTWGGCAIIPAEDSFEVIE